MAQDSFLKALMIQIQIPVIILEIILTEAALGLFAFPLRCPASV
jgi:hypothetical protein